MAMTDERWNRSGYSDIAAVEIVAGRLRITFANGDVVDVPAALAGSLEHAIASFDPDEALEVLVRDDREGEHRISWTQIRTATDADFAKHLRDLDAEESRRLARRLKALREDRGIPQADLAALVNMTAPQLSKIEAGTHDMRLSTVRSLLRALGATFADLSGDVPEMSVKRLGQKLSTAGVPREMAERLLGRVPRQVVHTLLERAFGWTRDAVLEGELRSRELATAVQFKAPAGQQPPQQAPLIHLGWAVARAGRNAAGKERAADVPDDPAVVRAEVQTDDGDITLASLLDWTWRRGIPVLPMLGKGVFAAAVWAVDGDPVVVLKEARDLAVFWLFDLAHELGHIARGHLSGGAVIDVASPTASSVVSSTDLQEREANEFALHLLVPRYPELVDEVRQRSRGNYLAFKGAVATTAARHRVNPGVLGMITAYEISDIGERKDRWGSATNLAKADGAGREVALAVARARLRLDDLDELDRALLETVVLAE
jgi:transcriptional regulator with XRE-family HTH domain/Zn-dependent peptidase ImmA (M78 family)